MRRLRIIAPIFLLALALFLAQYICPLQGIGLSESKREFNSLKNRSALPRESDFDYAVTLASLLQPGEDRARWAASRAAAVQGYVVAVREGSVESTNCYSPMQRDTHIELALRPDAPARERVILEVTPRMRGRAKGQGRDWSTAALAGELVGHWCRFEGWLLFDSGHADEAENTAPGRADNWRATAWEVHPVTYLEVVK
ncbi:MAG TPA: hypothetical protein VF762_03780 [Blastocatellia bacterium]